MSNNSRPYIGVMTGNSMDAADAVLMQFDEGTCQFLATAREPIADELAVTMREFANSGEINATTFLKAQNDLTETCVRAVAGLRVTAAEVAAIGCHGQTIAHRPHAGATWQMLNGALLAERCGLDVICDFRARDVAAGGEGAPMAPLFHHYLFAAAAPCDVVNIGGIANITHIRADGTSGYDLGPGVMLLDAWCEQQLGKRFDEDGQFAAQGKPSEAFLRQLLAHEFFCRPPPKSCGREEFSLPQFLPTLPSLPPADIQATFTELTARLIAEAVAESISVVYICGGGGRNKQLMQRLADLLGAKIEIKMTDDVGVPAEYMEAALCAWLAKCHLQQQPLAISRQHLRIAGAHYPR